MKRWVRTFLCPTHNTVCSILWTVQSFTHAFVDRAATLADKRIKSRGETGEGCSFLPAIIVELVIRYTILYNAMQSRRTDREIVWRLVCPSVSVYHLFMRVCFAVEMKI